MRSKVLWLLGIALVETLVEVSLLYYMRTCGPLPFKIKINAADVDIPGLGG